MEPSSEYKWILSSNWFYAYPAETTAARRSCPQREATMTSSESRS